MEAKISAKPSVIAAGKKLERYMSFCGEMDLTPFPPSYIPVGEFLLSLVNLRQVSTRSLGNDLSRLRTQCQLRRLGWFSYDDEIHLRQFLSVVRGEDFSESKVKDALRFSILSRIIVSFDLNDSVQLLKATVLAVGHNMLLRVGELTSGILAHQFTWRLHLSFALALPRTKTYRSGSGVSIALDNFGHPFAAVALLQRWWKFNNFGQHPQAYIFPAIVRGVIMYNKPMTGDFVRSIIKSSVSALGLDPNRFSGHSLRAGGATDLFASRIPYWVIKKIGQWTSDAALWYYRSEEDVVSSFRKALKRISRVIM
jgi:hypothetical protein